MPVIDMTLDEMREDYDWGEVFADTSAGNTTKDVDSPDDTPLDEFTRNDVQEIIALVDGENDSEEWVGIFRLKDGRFLAAAGGCDYTGWDCRAGNSLTVAKTQEAIIRYGLTPEQAVRLGLEHPGN